MVESICKFILLTNMLSSREDECWVILVKPVIVGKYANDNKLLRKSSVGECSL